MSRRPCSPKPSNKRGRVTRKFASTVAQQSAQKAIGKGDSLLITSCIDDEVRSNQGGAYKRMRAATANDDVDMLGSCGRGDDMVGVQSIGKERASRMVIQGTALLTPVLERGVKNTHSNETADKSNRAMTYRVDGADNVNVFTEGPATAGDIRIAEKGQCNGGGSGNGRAKEDSK